MELKINIEYEQILRLIFQLPKEDIERLANTLLSEISKKRSKEKLQEMLLKAPTWTENDFSDYKNARDQLNKSRLG